MDCLPLRRIGIVENTTVPLRSPRSMHVEHSPQRIARTTLQSILLFAVSTKSNWNDTSSTVPSCPQKMQSSIVVVAGPGIRHRRGGSTRGRRIAMALALRASLMANIVRIKSDATSRCSETTTEARNEYQLPPTRVDMLRESTPFVDEVQTTCMR